MSVCVWNHFRIVQIEYIYRLANDVKFGSKLQMVKLLCEKMGNCVTDEAQAAWTPAFFWFPCSFQKRLFPQDQWLRICLLKGEPITGRENFRLLQIESICKRQNKCSWNHDFYLWLGRKHCGKRRKCWLPAFSPFPTMFSIVFKGLVS